MDEGLNPLPLAGVFHLDKVCAPHFAVFGGEPGFEFGRAFFELEFELGTGGFFGHFGFGFLAGDFDSCRNCFDGFFLLLRPAAEGDGVVAGAFDIDRPETVVEWAPADVALIPGDGFAVGVPVVTGEVGRVFRVVSQTNTYVSIKYR